jgi:hypothetical protein
MLKKLCVLFVGLVCCLGTVGCGDNKPAELPKEKIDMPAAEPTNQTKEIEVPA